MTTQPPDLRPALTTAELLAVWEVVAARRATYDSMMWQTPALGMTAQAFLFTLSLSGGTSDAARTIAAGLSIIISVLVVQLLAKHRTNEFLDSLALEALESRLGLAERAGFHPHSKTRYSDPDRVKARESGRGVLLGPTQFWEMSSFRLWCYGQYLFIAAAALIIILVATGGTGSLNP